MKQFLLITTLMLVNFVAQAQHFSGRHFDRYVGLQRSDFNPALLAYSPYAFDFHVIGTGAFVDNNYIYLKEANLLKIANKDAIIETSHRIDDILPPNGATVVEIYDHEDERYISAAVRQSLPSIAFRIAQNHQFAIINNFRTHIYSNDIPAIFGYYNWDSLQYNVPTELHSTQLNASAYTEHGIRYAYLNEDNDIEWSIGAQVNYIVGFEAMSLVGGLNPVLTRHTSDSLTIVGGALDLAYTNSRFEQDYEVKVKGQGFGINIGATISEYSQDFYGYKWIVGVGLSDIGAINYTKDAERHFFKLAVNDTAYISSIDYEPIEYDGHIIKQVSQDIYGDPDASLQDTQFKMGLPIALTINGTYNFTELLGIQGAYTQPLRLKGANLTSSSQFSAAPVLNHRWVSAALPVVVNDWRQVQVGFYLRLGFFHIGTDRLSSYFSTKDLKGTDVYLGLNFNFLQWPEKMSGGGRGTPCYKF